jgi:hypothetical protein
VKSSTIFLRLVYALLVLKVCVVAEIAHAQTSVDEVDKLVRSSQEKGNTGDNPEYWQPSVTSAKIVTNDDLNKANHASDERCQKRINAASSVEKVEASEILQRYFELRKQAYSSFYKEDHDAFITWADGMMHSEFKNPKPPTSPRYISFVNQLTALNKEQERELDIAKSEYRKAEDQADKVCDTEKKIILDKFSEANPRVGKMPKL